MTTCGALPNPVVYLHETGAYRVGNVCVCTVSECDTLSSTSGSGNVAKLPPFPRRDSDPSADYAKALAHATVRASAPSGHCGLAHGCSLDWFRQAGHDKVLMGDEHTPRTWRESGMLAAQPGSVLTQTFGEPVQGHGLCVWDLAAHNVEHVELSNPYAGVSAVRASDGAIQFWARGRASKTSPLSASEARSLPWFPTTPRVRLLGAVREQDVLRALGLRSCRARSWWTSSRPPRSTFAQLQLIPARTDRRSPAMICASTPAASAWRNTSASASPTAARPMRWPALS
jgi:hypothetical protein